MYWAVIHWQTLGLAIDTTHFTLNSCRRVLLVSHTKEAQNHGLCNLNLLHNACII
jgi:hypothetical protein